jgi:hypothetical protein
MAWPLRACVVERWVREKNEAGEFPFIMELAPGGFWLAEGLRHRECDFSYKSIGLDPGDWKGAASQGEAGQPTLFCAFEIIEHLANEQEIYQNYLKFNREADVVMLSTPLYTCAGVAKDWRGAALGHLRTYTVGEFHEVASRMFQGREWSCVTDDTIVLMGVKK